MFLDDLVAVERCWFLVMRGLLDHSIILPMQLSHPKPVNRCHVCGGTSYHHLVERNEYAELRSTQTLVCDGCGRSFPDVRTWRDGVPTMAQEQGA